ncbi:MAG TPA: TetR/AcrR family transcriptional regulator [Acidimicrobiales bacterium]|jgi:AcrR family transcriptional regulator|nr:TetR/AcrR family transcriptional regulator [Acidimicrobiales bacterium]
MRGTTGVNTRRDEILATAASLFARQGIAGTTVRDIADAVGILSGSLYHHFESKEEMVEEIISSYLEDLLVRYRAVDGDGDPLACLKELIRTSFQSLESHAHACEIYQNDFNYITRLPRYNALRRISQNTQRIWLDTLDAGVAQGALRGDVDTAVFYRFLRDAIWMSIRWHRPGSRRKKSELAEDCIAVFIEGYAVAR